MLAIVALLQSVVGPPAPVARKVPIADAKRCAPAANPDEIMVCGRNDDAFRLKPLPDLYVPAKGPPRAEATIGDGMMLSAEAEQASDAQGAPINRAMIRFKKRF